jgi:hypothetical protein
MQISILLFALFYLKYSPRHCQHSGGDFFSKFGKEVNYEKAVFSVALRRDGALSGRLRLED